MVMVMNDLLPPLCAMSIGPPILRYSYFEIWPWKSMVKVMCVVKGYGHIRPSKFKGQGQGQNHWHVWPWKFKVKVMAKSNMMVTFEALSSIDMFAIRFVAIRPFWLRYSKFYIWPWKFKVKVRAKVKSDGHIWALDFNRYVCFSSCGNRIIFGWDIANSIFDLENSRSRSWPRSNPMVTFEP